MSTKELSNFSLWYPKIQNQILEKNYDVLLRCEMIEIRYFCPLYTICGVNIKEFYKNKPLMKHLLLHSLFRLPDGVNPKLHLQHIKNFYTTLCFRYLDMHQIEIVKEKKILDGFKFTATNSIYFWNGFFMREDLDQKECLDILEFAISQGCSLEKMETIKKKKTKLFYPLKEANKRRLRLVSAKLIEHGARHVPDQAICAIL